MRHRKAHRKLSRTWAHRRALLRNLVTALFQYERIETTDRYLRAIAVDACVLKDVLDTLLSEDA